MSDILTPNYWLTSTFVNNAISSKVYTKAINTNVKINVYKLKN